MKNILTLIFTFSIFSASAQYSVAFNKSKANNVCIERGHNLTFTKSATFRAPYTIDTKDSTVTVYPAPHSSTGTCSRCGAEVESHDKDIRITTWRRADKVVTATTKSVVAAPVIDNTNWGNNIPRSLNLAIKSSSLDDIKKVATLKNDTLFVHKRIAPFNSLKEQVVAYSTIYYKDKPITFKTAIFDEAAFYSGKNGIEIY